MGISSRKLPTLHSRSGPGNFLVIVKFASAEKQEEVDYESIASAEEEADSGSTV